MPRGGIIAPLMVATRDQVFALVGLRCFRLQVGQTKCKKAPFQQT